LRQCKITLMMRDQAQLDELIRGKFFSDWRVGS
jgi:hypothetical protein